MIRVENVTRRFADRVPVNDVSFTVGEGEIVGFLGPNGAGKTTTMRMIAGYLKPTRGEIVVGEYNVNTHPLAARQTLGYLPESVAFRNDMTVVAHLRYLARLRGLDRASARRRSDEVAGLCGLSDHMNRAIGRLSKGYRQRVGLAQALVHDPDVLVLDEPTVSVDPIEAAEFRTLIRRLGTGHTVLLSSHLLSEVARICDRVVVMNRGRKVAEDTVAGLSQRFMERLVLRLVIGGPDDGIADALASLDGVEEVRREEGAYLVVSASGEDPRRAILAEIIARNWVLDAMTPVEMDLEEIFIRLTREEAVS